MFLIESKIMVMSWYHFRDCSHPSHSLRLRFSWFSP